MARTDYSTIHWNRETRSYGMDGHNPTTWWRCRKCWRNPVKSHQVSKAVRRTERKQRNA